MPRTFRVALSQRRLLHFLTTQALQHLEGITVDSPEYLLGRDFIRARLEKHPSIATRFASRVATACFNMAEERNLEQLVGAQHFVHDELKEFLIAIKIFFRHADGGVWLTPDFAEAMGLEDQ